MTRLGCLLTGFMVCASAFGGVFTGDWLELIDTSKLPLLRDDQCLQISSYDRTGGNNDGFSGEFSYLRKEDGAFVIFEDEGPGCVYRIWSANPGARRIEFYFDGEEEPRLVFDEWQDMFLGKVDPFRPPISQHELGGWISYVPLPYKKSLKVITRERVNFYQFTYQKFADADGVKTFTPGLSEEDCAKFERVRQVWSSLGQAPWQDWPGGAEPETVNAQVSIESGGTATLFTQNGAGAVVGLRLRLTCGDPKFLRRAVIKIAADNAEPQVDCPIGDFFLQAFPGQNTQSLLCGRDPEQPDVFYAYWPMPYADGIRLEVVNEALATLKIEGQADWLSLEALPADIGRFHARWLRQNPTTEGELYPILDAAGRGHWCGVSVAMQGYGPGLGFLEGDEMLWIDRRDNTFFNGTGSEDYYNGGWYFGGTGSYALYGCGTHDAGNGRCHAFRLHITDLVPYQEKARIGIEHGHGNAYPADYAGTTFWYAAPSGTSEEAPALNAADRLWQPKTLAGFAEAEKLVEETFNAQVTEGSATPHFFSAGEAVLLEETGATIHMRLPVEADDVYEVSLHFAAAVPGAKAKVSLDGAPPLEKMFELAAANGGGETVTLGKTRLAPDTQTLYVRSERGRFALDAIRFQPSAKRKDALEAESLDANEIDGARAARHDLRVAGASGDSYVVADCPAPGSGVEFTWEAKQLGVYGVVLRLMRGPECVPVRVLLDGAPVGKASCEASKNQWDKPRAFGPTPPIEAGPHTLTVLALEVKDEDQQGGLIGLDFLSPFIDGVYEGFKLYVLDNAPGSAATPELSRRLEGLHNERQLFYNSVEPQAFITVEVPVAKGGTRRIYADLIKTPQGGQYRLMINGQAVGDVFDGYDPGLASAKRVPFGAYDFKPGVYEFRFQAVGRQEQALSYGFGIDRLVIE